MLLSLQHSFVRHKVYLLTYRLLAYDQLTVYTDKISSDFMTVLIPTFLLIIQFYLSHVTENCAKQK